MPYTVAIKPKAEKYLAGIHDARLYRRPREAIGGLAIDPRASGSLKMQGADELYRVRVGDYRIVCQIQWFTKSIDLIRREAEEGSRAAMVCYAMSLENGKGVERDPAAASKFYARAAALGESTSVQWCAAHHVNFKPINTAQGQGILTIRHNGAIGGVGTTP